MRIALTTALFTVVAISLLPLRAGENLSPVDKPDRGGKPARSKRWRAPKDLADWKIFPVEDGKLVHRPMAGVIPYDLNTPLFSDYAAKYRFVKLPEGAKARYTSQGVLEFPVESVIAKTFSYPHDMRDLSKGERILETRLLYFHESGWKALTYQWNAEQTGATLSTTGDIVPSSWIDVHGTAQKNDYIIPDQNKCASCHENGAMNIPLGPTACNLNKDYRYADGVDNQLSHWVKAGILEGVPADLTTVPKLAVWNDPSTGNLDQRARAYLEANCAHCHNAKGPARTSGLELTYNQTDTEKFGVWKTPIAVGRGGGGRKYSIVPGHPDESILYFRINSTDGGIMMPEVARRMVDKEGVELIRQWIAAMPDPVAND